MSSNVGRVLSEFEQARVLRVESYAAEVAIAGRFWNDDLLALNGFRRDVIRLADGLGQMFLLHRPISTGESVWCLACSQGRQRKICYPCNTVASVAERVETTSIYPPEIITAAATASQPRRIATDHMTLALPFRVLVEKRGGRA